MEVAAPLAPVRELVSQRDDRHGLQLLHRSVQIWERRSNLSADGDEDEALPALRDERNGVHRIVVNHGVAGAREHVDALLERPAVVVRRERRDVLEENGAGLQVDGELQTVEGDLNPLVLGIPMTSMTEGLAGAGQRDQ